MKTENQKEIKDKIKKAKGIFLWAANNANGMYIKINKEQAKELIPNGCFTFNVYDDCDELFIR